VGHVLAQGPWEIVSFPATAERRSMIVAGARSLADGHNVGLTMWATIPLFSVALGGYPAFIASGSAARINGILRDARWAAADCGPRHDPRRSQAPIARAPGAKFSVKRSGVPYDVQTLPWSGRAPCPAR